MRDSIVIETAGVTCRFLNIGSDNQYSFCCDKADPWKIQANKEADISVQEYLTGWNAEGKYLISNECTGGFYSRVYKDEKKNIYKTIEQTEVGVLIAWKINVFENKITLIHDITRTAGYLAFENAGTILPQFLLKYGLCTMHGVLMEYHDSGIILTADSGVGKTTHARLWRNYKKAIIINGDRITFRKEQEDWIGYGLPWSGSSGEQMNRKAPIRAVVQIVRSEENFAERLSGIEAFEVVLGQLLTPAWDPELAGIAVDIASGLAEEVSVWRMHCNMDPEAADVLERTLFS